MVGFQSSAVQRFLFLASPSALCLMAAPAMAAAPSAVSVPTTITPQASTQTGTTVPAPDGIAQLPAHSGEQITVHTAPCLKLSSTRTPHLSGSQSAPLAHKGVPLADNMTGVFSTEAMVKQPDLVL